MNAGDSNSVDLQQVVWTSKDEYGNVIAVGSQGEVLKMTADYYKGLETTPDRVRLSHNGPPRIYQI